MIKNKRWKNIVYGKFLIQKVTYQIQIQIGTKIFADNG